MKNSEITINAIFIITLMTLVLVNIILFRSTSPKTEIIENTQSVYMVQKDTIGWRLIREIQGTEKGSGSVIYSGYTDSIGVLKSLKAVIIAKQKLLDLKSSDKELQDLKTLLDKVAVRPKKS